MVKFGEGGVVNARSLLPGCTGPHRLTSGFQAASWRKPTKLREFLLLNILDEYLPAWIGRRPCTFHLLISRRACVLKRLSFEWPCYIVRPFVFLFGRIDRKRSARFFMKFWELFRFGESTYVIQIFVFSNNVLAVGYVDSVCEISAWDL